VLKAHELEHIRAEEIFRDEVRRSLDGPISRAEKLGAFLNSPLGLFLLSAVFLSSLSAFATHWYEAQQKKAATSETVRRLDIEIGHRLERLTILIQPVVTYTQLHSAREAIVGKHDTDPDVGRLGEFEAIFPEFENRTLFFLIWELKRSLAGTEAESLTKPLNTAKELDSFASQMKLVAPVGKEDSKWTMPEATANEYKVALANLKLARWEQ